MASFIASILGGLGFGKSNATESKTANTYQDLREQVLTLDPAKIGFKPSGSNRIWGILMETGYPDAVATLVTVADGSVSLYFSNGGGIIGAGQHDGPRKACESFLGVAPKFLSYAHLTTDYPLPKNGQTKFYFLTLDGDYTAEAKEEDLGNERHPLSPLFYEAQKVITQARLVDEKVRGTSTRRSGNEDSEVFKALMYAVTNGDTDSAKKLLARGIDPNAADSTGLTPLMAAAYKGKENTLQLLIEVGASVTAKDSSGYTALMFASNAGDVVCAQILLEHGAAVNEGDNDGSTPLMFAAQHGHNTVVKLLLSRGADPARIGKHGLSAIAFAEQNGMHETATILKDKK